jgi:DNA-binding transcriptional LysR family regulator
MPASQREPAASEFTDERLKCLFLSAKFGTMRAAADALGVAPSSVSRQIAQLERSLQAPLVEKNSHTVRLTEIGQYVADYYRDRMAKREVLLATLSDIRGVHTGQYTVALDQSLVGIPLLSALQAFRQQHPGVSLDIATGACQEIVAMVGDDQAHLGLVFEAQPDPRLRVKASFRQPLKAVVAPGHPLARRASVTVAELLAFPVNLPRDELRVWELLQHAVGDTARPLSAPAMRSNSGLMLREAARTGASVSVLPELAIADELDAGRLIAVALDEPRLQGTQVAIVTRLGRELPPGANALLNAVTRALARWQ